MSSTKTAAVPEGVTIGSFLGVLWRRRLLVALLVVLLGAAGAAFSASRPATYSAQAVVNVTPVTTGLSAGASSKDISTITEVKIVTSTSVARLAAAQMGYTGGAGQLLKHVTATSPLDSQVVVITFSSAVADRAATGANAFADAYLSYRQDTTQQVITRRAEKLEDRVAALRRSITATAEEARAAPSGSVARSEAESLRKTLQQQVSNLLGQQNTLLTVAVSPGEVISRASTPSQAGLASRLVYPVAGVLFGFVLGALLAVVRDRRDDRVRGSRDAAAAAGAPLLTDIAVRRGRGSERGTIPALAAAGSVEQEGYRVLAAKLLTGTAERRRVLVTACPSGVTVDPSAALNLALALGAPAVRVAYLTSSEGIAVAAGQLRLPADSTLATWPAQLVAVPSQPQVSLLSLGDEASLGSLDLTSLALQLQAFDVVVINGLAFGRQSSTFLLARLVTGALVLVEEGRTSAGEIERWNEQLAQVGVAVEGAVLLRKRRRTNGLRSARSGGTPLPTTLASPAAAAADPGTAAPVAAAPGLTTAAPGEPALPSLDPPSLDPPSLDPPSLDAPSLDPREGRPARSSDPVGQHSA